MDAEEHLNMSGPLEVERVENAKKNYVPNSPHLLRPRPHGIKNKNGVAKILICGANRGGG